MSGYGQAQVSPARHKSGQGFAAEHRTAAPVHAHAADSLAASLNRSPTSLSLLQLHQALDGSPHVQALSGLQQALNRTRAAEANEDERPLLGARSGPAQLAALPGNADARPAAVQNGPVIQRWTEEYGGKLSEGNNLLLRGEQDLYASGEKFEEANAIGGDVEFGQGGQINEPKPLTKVVPTVKEGSELARETQGFDAGKQEELIRDNIRQRISIAKLEKAIMDARVEAARKDQGDDFDEEEFRDDIESEVSEEAQKTTAGLGADLPAYDDEPAIRNLNQYLAKQKDAGRPLIPSDCARAVGRIAGYLPTAGVRIEQAIAGAVHSYTEEAPNKGEWPYHVATIVMTDGADHVTMENAGARQSEEFDKLEYDRTWYFAMYGAQRGQTFGDVYKTDFRDQELPNDRLRLLGPKK